VRGTLLRVPVEAWAAAADVTVATFDRCVDMIRAAKAMVVRVELGIQQGVNSTHQLLSREAADYAHR